MLWFRTGPPRKGKFLVPFETGTTATKTPATRNWINRITKRKKEKDEGDPGPVSDPMSILPPELLEHIIMCIDAGADLLNVALTSKAMCSLVLPHHLQLRTIHCEDAHESVWTSLIETPIFASYITKLILWGSCHAHYIYKDGVCLGATSIPKFLDLAPRAWNAQNPSSELAPALSQMVNLHTFSWWTGMGSNPSAITATLLVLASLRRLRSFEFQWSAYAFHTQTTDLDFILRPIIQLRNLEEFKFRYRGRHVQPPNNFAILNDVTDMLVHHCPDLQTLSIIIHKSVAPPVNPWFFSGAHWPCLRNLTLKWRWGEDRPTDDLDGFLERHNASLSSLDWRIHGEGDRVIPILPNLPKLHSLHICDLRQIPNTAHLSNLRALSLSVCSASFEDIVSSRFKMDRVEQVHFKCGDSYYYMTKIRNIEDLDSWREALAKMFPNIRHLSGLTIYNDAYLPYETASRLADTLPRLLHLELILHSKPGSFDGMPSEEGREKIIIRRNDRVSRTRRTRPGEIVDYTQWG
ncbi:hypothetical protein B0H17DRAFT_1099694 [Mycena rosella]|uniref:F-box domain-containing protein n=1 Tax=Mycena rosella TaxID=1033263 RepID=A0AAD7CNG0_MYCRO|nr:hypothetical protein B0H17DRAFT_1099694 [Mycena rosella]